MRKVAEPAPLGLQQLVAGLAAHPITYNFAAFRAALRLARDFELGAGAKNHNRQS
jgi:hypothetical protein